MTFDQMKQRFQSIRTVTVTKVNKMGLFVGIVLFPTFLFMAGLFLVMMISGAVVEVNGVDYFPGSPEYDAFYLSSLTIAGILLLVDLAIIVLFSFPKPQFAFTLGIDEAQDGYLYVETRREAKWIGQSRMIIYSKARNTCHEVKETESIQAAKEEVAFWLRTSPPDKLVLKEKPNGFSVKFRQYRYGRNQTRSIRVFEGPDGKIRGFRELIWDSYAGGGNLQSSVVYTFSDINRNVRPLLPEALKRALLKIE
jgi:hypothetical protein